MSLRQVELITTTTVKVALDVEVVAKWFCGLSDEQQADFFIAVGKEAVATFPGDHMDQWWYVGRHLRTCSCSTEAAREVVKGLHRGLEHVPA